MSKDLQAKFDTFYQNAGTNTPLSKELSELLESSRTLLQEFVGLWELLPIGSRVTQTQIDGRSTYDYIALTPSFPEDLARPPAELIRRFAQYLTRGLRSSFGVTVQAPTVQFWYRGEPKRILSIHPTLYLVNHSEWTPGTPSPSAIDRTWYYPSGERQWSAFDQDARSAWIEQLDQNTQGQLRRIIQLLKAWKYRSEFTVRSFLFQPGAENVETTQSLEGLPIYSYFLECAACNWLNQYPSNGTTYQEDVTIVQQVLSDLAVKVRQACNNQRDVFIYDPSGAVDPGLLSASAYDEQSIVANQLERSAAQLALLLPDFSSTEVDATLVEMFGLMSPISVSPAPINELPLQPYGGESWIGVSEVTNWLWQLDRQCQVSDALYPVQEVLIDRIRHHQRYWREAGSTRNGTAVRGYSDCDFLVGLPIVTHKNPPQSILLRFEALLKSLLDESIESHFDAPAFVLWPAGYRELAVDIVPVVRVSEVERRWAEPQFNFGQPKIDPYQGISGTFSEPWPQAPEDLVFCINAQMFYPINPELHLDWLDKADNVFNGYARVLIRLLKLWKYQQCVPITSYYIEMFIVRWLMMGHHVDGRNIQEIVLQCPRSKEDVEKLPRFTPCMNASEDLSHILCDLHEHFREPISQGKMPGMQDMSTEDWWARAMPCNRFDDVRASLQVLRDSYELTARACIAEREWRFAKAIALWQQFFRLPAPNIKDG